MKKKLILQYPQEVSYKSCIRTVNTESKVLDLLGVGKGPLKLDISDNNLSNNFIIELSKLLKNSNVKFLNISNCGLKYKELCQIFENLPDSKIEELDLSGNLIDGTLLDYLNKGNYLFNLRTLNIKSNKPIDDKTLEKNINVFHNAKKMFVLSIFINNLSKENLKPLISLDLAQINLFVNSIGKLTLKDVYNVIEKSKIIFIEILFEGRSKANNYHSIKFNHNFNKISAQLVNILSKDLVFDEDIKFLYKNRKQLTYLSEYIESKEKLNKLYIKYDRIYELFERCDVGKDNRDYRHLNELNFYIKDLASLPNSVYFIFKFDEFVKEHNLLVLGLLFYLKDKGFKDLTKEIFKFSDLSLIKPTSVIEVKNIENISESNLTKSRW